MFTIYNCAIYSIKILKNRAITVNTACMGKCILHLGSEAGVNPPLLAAAASCEDLVASKHQQHIRHML